MSDKRLALFEALGTVAWMVMDYFWMLKNFDVAGPMPATIIGPIAVLLNLLIILFTERKIIPMCLAGASAAWTVMNASWMLFDLHAINGLRPVGIIAGPVMFVLVGIAGAYGQRNALFATLFRLRRFRLRPPS